MSVDSLRVGDCGKVVIGIGGLAIRQSHAGLIITHALGSCLGVTAWDATNRIGGMLHAQLPLAQQNQQRAATQPSLFVDLGLTLLLKHVIDLGADRRRLRLVVAGGANMNAGGNDVFQIAARNLTVFRKTLWRESLVVAAEEVGGGVPRTMTLRLDSGETIIDSQGQRRAI